MNRVVALGAAAGLAVTMLVANHGMAASPPTNARTPAAVLRVDSVGFLTTDNKRAYLMTQQPVKKETVAVENPRGDVVFKVNGGLDDRGRWSAAYPHVYEVDLEGLTSDGIYSLHATGDVSAVSQSFRVEGPSALYDPLITDGVAFFQNQRDGADQVAGPLDRQPSHLNDATAAVYELPRFVHPAGSDRIDGSLHRIGHGTVDAEGGWFDAGDFLKFTHTAAYADVLLEASQRALGHDAPDSLVAEAHYGESWLAKMWDQKSKTLYLQVGAGGGNTKHTFYGDHDLWRLPQVDDGDSKAKDTYAAAHRPVFRAAASGKPISPNLAGRVSAAFALAAQNDADGNPARATTELRSATTIYGLADTKSAPRPLVTAEPYGYYPEDSWHDDMALGGAEIALAETALMQNPTPYIQASAHWSKAYLHHDASSETFNLYDTSALAMSDLAKLRAANPGVHAGVSQSQALAELRRQITHAAKRSGKDPFRAAGYYDEFDVDSHTFGLIATIAMYDADTGSSAYQAVATAQRDWLFGANAWGASFMVGEGANYPHCMQHQVANLSGSLDGDAPIDVGAVVNGPNDAGIFRGGLGSRQDGVRRCPNDGLDTYRPFTGHGSRYVDDARAYQTSEPAIDMTGTAILAAALAKVSS